MLFDLTIHYIKEDYENSVKCWSETDSETTRSRYSQDDLKSINEEPTAVKAKPPTMASRPQGAMRFKEIVKKVQDSEEIKAKNKRVHLWLDLKELTFTALGYKKNTTDHTSLIAGKTTRVNHLMEKAHKLATH